MSGQTFRENIEQEVHYVVYATNGDTEDLIRELVDWVVGRFGPGAPDSASGKYLEEAGAELSAEFREVYEARKGQEVF